jgi:antitoxin HicB
VTGDGRCGVPRSSYLIELVQDTDEDGNRGWIAKIEELPGCISQGATPEAAIANVRDAMLGWISVALEDDQDIPQPRALGNPRTS